LRTDNAYFLKDKFVVLLKGRKAVLMSAGYVIAGVSKDDLLEYLKNIHEITVEDHPDSNDYKVLTMKVDPKYLLRKRMALGNLLAKTSDAAITPDSLSEGTTTASVFINMGASDTENTWFEGFAVSVRHPETILETIVEHLRNIGVETQWASEHQELYQKLADCEDEDE
jgi:hypothetical protein